MANREIIGKKVALARKKLGKTQAQIASLTGINKTTLSEIENGRFTGSLDIFERYLDAVELELIVTPKEHKLPTWEELDHLFEEDE